MSLTFSIVTPSLNQGKFIEQTICSILSQEGDFYIDYIIIDGGSTDETLSIIMKYELLLQNKQFPVRCKGISYRWLSEPDRGQSHAINKGFSLANGGILAWLNSDDYYEKGAFKSVTEVNWGNNNFCYGKGSWISESGIFISNYPTFHPNKYSLYVNCTLCQPTVFFTMETYKSLGDISETYKLVFDYEYWLRAVFAEMNFVNIPKILACSRMHEKNKSISSGRLGEWEVWDLKNAYYQNMPLNPVKLKLYRTAIELITNYKDKFLTKKIRAGSK